MGLKFKFTLHVLLGQVKTFVSGFLTDSLINRKQVKSDKNFTKIVHNMTKLMKFDVSSESNLQAFIYLSSEICNQVRLKLTY